MPVTQALASGLAGSIALTLVHETARHLLPDAPRADLLGMRAIAAALRGTGHRPPERRTLFEAALAGDLASNGLYYSLVGAGRPETAVRRGLLLGLAAGLGAVVAPEPLGLGRGPSARTPATALMTVGWYSLGGVVAGLAYRRLAAREAA